MNGNFIIITIILIMALLALLIAKLVSFLRNFANDTRCICYEMEHADSYEEYSKCRSDLRCHYLCLIPFVNDKNVKRVYHYIFCKPKHAESQKRKDGIVPLLLPSVLGICVCMVCICGMTWAWYSASIQAPTQTLSAAYFDVTVESVANDESKIEPIDGVYNLEADIPYTVTLKANGTVKDCGGYCVIESAETDAKSYTQSLKPNETLEFSFTPEDDGIYTFTGVWGSHPAGTDENDILKGILTYEDGTKEDFTDNVNADTENSVSEEPPDEQASAAVDGTYTVQNGDTLSAIAAKYNTTAEKLAAYNNIADAAGISVGQKLNLPPQDYEIPQATESNIPQESEPNPGETNPETLAPPVTELPSEPITEPTEKADIPAYINEITVQD